MKRLVALLIVALLVACTPAANIARNLVERADGSSLVYLTDGVGFDPGGRTARGVIVIVIFDELESFRAPEGATCEAEGQVLDCRLGDVSNRVAILLSATNVNASATFRRDGASTIYQVFAY